MARRKTRGKGEGSLYQRKADGMWIARVELPPHPSGKRRYKQVARRLKKDAQAELAKLLADLAEHGDITADSSLTVERWLTHWLRDVAPKGSKGIVPKTLEGYTASVRTHIVPAIGDRPLAKLVPQDVRTLHEKMRSKPADVRLRDVPEEEWPEGTKLLSSTTVLLAHNVLSKALGDAMKEPLGLRYNPCDRVTKPGKAATEAHALTVEEAVKVIAYCTTIPDGPLWAAYLLTACRRGELLGLETDRVTDILDLSWQMQRISNVKDVPDGWEYRTVKGTLRLTRPKSDAGWRIIPLVGPLKPFVALALQSSVGGLVFTEWKKTGDGWVNTGRPWDPDRATARWKQVVAEAGIEGDVVVHDLRHTTVDLLYEAGVDEQVIQDLVGHSSIAMTRKYRTKGRRNMALLSAAMESVGRQLELPSGSTGR